MKKQRQYNSFNADSGKPKANKRRFSVNVCDYPRVICGNLRSILIILCFVIVNSLPLNIAQSAVAEALPNTELSPADEANLIEHWEELETWDLMENMEMLQNLELLENIDVKSATVKGS